MTPRYAELQATSNFSFLEGGSHPEELMAEAAHLGLEALAVTDRNSLAGVVRAHVAAKEHGLRLVVGARLDLMDSHSLLAFPRDRAAYGRLCRLITLGRRRAEKGSCELYRSDVAGWAEGLLLVFLPPLLPAEELDATIAGELRDWTARCPGRVYLAAQNLLLGGDRARLERLAEIAETCKAPLLATNDVLMHVPERRPLADVLTCIREKCSIDTAGRRLLKNAERHLKPPQAMAELFAGYPEAVARTVEIAEACRFSLDELSYQYPEEIEVEGEDTQTTLTRLAKEGARRRYPGGVPAKVAEQIDYELKLIGELDYAPYFLTVRDMVAFARDNGILCQGRGSAANSAVCFCLGLTSVDPARMELLFERFVSAERNEPPDIDIDFEHERREEVIQHIYQRYGRERAGLAATVIHFRARRALREVGKAMGLSEDTVSLLASEVWGWSSETCPEERLGEIGLDPRDRRLQLTLRLADELIGFPRHLSQHVGGFVITRDRLDEVVPVENAAMAERTVVEWDKDDLDALGMLKVDVLALGMLTCLRKGFDLLRSHYGRDLDLATVPPEDSGVYDMLCTGDSVGVFQVESRAQMAFLPRMKPRNFYDLVIEVAIVRPGPIQGNMVHPYIRRRNGEEEVRYPSKDLEQVLERTLGVPLFQEQAMKIAIVAAGFTPSEADRLRRAMATFRRVGTIHLFQEKMVEGMKARGYDPEFAERCFRQIEGFGEYGFPESHAASFALLVYVSAWMKRRYPAAFACALLNSQPMGFYAPAQIVRDLRDHGVEVRPVDVNHSFWDCSLEPGGDPDGPGQGMALRLGLRQVKGVPQEEAEWLTAARGNGYGDPVALWRKAGLKPAVLEKLAKADAFASLGLDRRQALWAIKPLGDKPLPLFEAMGEEDRGAEPEVALPEMTLGDQVVEDYRALRLTLRTHPLALLRDRFERTALAEDLVGIDHGTRISTAGLVIARQRPGTAKGVIFITLEDETGVSNIVVWARVYEAHRREVLTGRLLRVSGRLEREESVVHIIADKIEDLSPLLDGLSEAGGFEQGYAHADEVKHPVADDNRSRKVSPRPRHPREESKLLFPSRDFH